MLDACSFPSDFVALCPELPIDGVFSKVDRQLEARCRISLELTILSENSYFFAHYREVISFVNPAMAAY
jgi:hypothetical protein